MKHLGKCFEAGTLVRMYDDSLKPIEELNIGDIVYTYNPRGRQFLTISVQDVIAQKVRRMVQVKFDTGLVVKCTPEHQFACKCGAWKRADQLEWSRIAVMGEHDPPLVVEVLNLAPELITVYDLLIPTHHTFVITEKNIVVHDFTVSAVEFLNKPTA